MCRIRGLAFKAPPVKGHVSVVGCPSGIQREQLSPGRFRAAGSPATWCSPWISAVVTGWVWRGCRGFVGWRRGLTGGRIQTQAASPACPEAGCGRGGERGACQVAVKHGGVGVCGWSELSFHGLLHAPAIARASSLFELAGGVPPGCPPARGAALGAGTPSLALVWN